MRISFLIGLTEALRTFKCIREFNYNNEKNRIKVMVGCMVCSSLGVAPALGTLASVCDYVDLDGPYLLEEDVSSPIRYRDGGGLIECRYSEQLWG